MESNEIIISSYCPWRLQLCVFIYWFKIINLNATAGRLIRQLCFCYLSFILSKSMNNADKPMKNKTFFLEVMCLCSFAGCGMVFAGNYLEYVVVSLVNFRYVHTLEIRLA